MDNYGSVFKNFIADQLVFNKFLFFANVDPAIITGINLDENFNNFCIAKLIKCNKLSSDWTNQLKEHR